MDYHMIIARLKDLKALQMQAIRRGNKEKAEVLSEKAFELRKMWTESLSRMYQPWQEPAVSQGEENLGDLVQGGKGRDEVDEDCGSGYEYVPKREDEDAKMDKYRAAVTNFKLRKQYTFKSQDSAKAGNRKRKHHGDKPIKVYKNYHKKFIFPLAGCSACVERLAAHIKKVHGVNPSSNEYKSLLKKAFLKKRDPIQFRPRGEVAEEAVLPKRARLSSDDVSAVDVQEGVGESIGMVENGESMWEDDESSAPALLVNFEKWLQSPDGEKKDSKTVKQHAAQINRILPIIDTEKNLENLLGFVLIKEKFQGVKECCHLAWKAKWYSPCSNYTKPVYPLRDFLLVQISIDNANRAGVLANLTLKEFRRASKEDDRFVVNVREHKTFHIHGNAQAVLTSNLHNRMNVFIQEVTSQVPGIGVDENQPVSFHRERNKQAERKPKERTTTVTYRWVVT
ncbi:hypothetical protein pdam_00020687 [Pocillopora damicornis]|uniref:Uncharacterized protein n=1 Tax=Pocillopora damicornis TaxID=46731 RepID=A0A3M6UVX5_POCDA|nr:hypothetical protein pdam_00020687 [Pocillopora damicornis]